MYNGTVRYWWMVCNNVWGIFKKTQQSLLSYVKMNVYIFQNSACSSDIYNILMGEKKRIQTVLNYWKGQQIEPFPIHGEYVCSCTSKFWRELPKCVPLLSSFIYVCVCTFPLLMCVLHKLVCFIVSCTYVVWLGLLWRVVSSLAVLHVCIIKHS